MKERENFGSKIGIILAAAGSAVGLGNVWRFPYMTGENGGAAFILIYLFCVVALGWPAMVAEFIVGRHGGANPLRAYERMGGHKAWALPGIVGMVVSTVICGFYSVIAGWCLQYLVLSLTGNLAIDSTASGQYFAEFSSSAVLPTVWTVVFILLTYAVVVKGVRKGIERSSKIMMPLLFVLLLVLAVTSCVLSGASKGIEFLFKPDFSKLSPNVFLEAMGQAFFSLSLGAMVLCTYASYFGRQVNIVRSAAQIVLIDTLVAILAGLMIFPAAFSAGIRPDSGPSLVFITLPVVFGKAFGGATIFTYAVAFMFYLLLALAALTSTISMLETGTATLSEETRLSRRSAGGIVTLGAMLIGVLCSLSCGAVDTLKVAGQSMLDFCDFFTGQIVLPINSLITCLFVGYVIGSRVVSDEISNCGTLGRRWVPLYMFTVRVVCPLCIVAIFLHFMGLF